MPIQLWTIQSLETWKELETKGNLTATSNLHSPEWNSEYQWMAHQMKVRLRKETEKLPLLTLPRIIKKDTNVSEHVYPIWAWYQCYNSNKRRPDLRKHCQLPKGSQGVRISFLKKEEDVLLSNFALWHIPLGFKNFIGEDKNERLQFKRDLHAAKLENTSYSELPDAFKTRIEKSWEHIFDLNFDDRPYTLNQDEKKIQACVWEIKKSEIKDVDFFTAR